MSDAIETCPSCGRKPSKSMGCKEDPPRCGDNRLVAPALVQELRRLVTNAELFNQIYALVREAAANGHNAGWNAAYATAALREKFKDIAYTPPEKP